MKRYEVIIEYNNINRKNKLVIWANDEEQAKELALKSWRSPEYKTLEAKETEY